MKSLVELDSRTFALACLECHSGRVCTLETFLLVPFLAWTTVCVSEISSVHWLLSFLSTNHIPSALEAELPSEYPLRVHSNHGCSMSMQYIRHRILISWMDTPIQSNAPWDVDWRQPCWMEHCFSEFQNMMSPFLFISDCLAECGALMRTQLFPVTVFWWVTSEGIRYCITTYVITSL